MNKKILNKKNGTVVSDKMDKTITVSVNRISEHPIYKKKFILSRKYKAHDPENKFKIGDIVVIESCRPISRDKHYKVIK